MMERSEQFIRDLIKSCHEIDPRLKERFEELSKEEKEASLKIAQGMFKKGWIHESVYKI